MHDYRPVTMLLETMEESRDMYSQLEALIKLIEVDSEKAVLLLDQSYAASSALVEHFVQEYGLSVREAK